MESLMTDYHIITEEENPNNTSLIHEEPTEEIDETKETEETSEPTEETMETEETKEVTPTKTTKCPHNRRKDFCVETAVENTSVGTERLNTDGLLTNK